MNLQYDNIENINKLIEGYVDLHNDPALANRPLPTMKQCPCSVNTRNDLSKVKPNYNDNKNFGSLNYSDNGIPVVIQRHRDRYYVLDNKDNSMENGDVYKDDWAELSSRSQTTKEENKGQKMDIITRFYYGSIYVVALYVIFRAIQKSR
jgi:hypothetical protein